MSISDGDTSITVVKQAVLEFLEEMKRGKLTVEQEIRDQTDSVLGQYLNMGLPQYTRADLQELTKRFRKTFLDYYKNIIYLRIVSNASKNIRSAIEEGFVNSQIIEDELIMSIDEMRKKVGNMDNLSESISAYKNKIDEQAQLITELQASSSMNSGDMEIYNKKLSDMDRIIKQKDQILIEKEQEIMNLNQGLSHMENQSNSLGESLLDGKLQIEELQETINDKDLQIEGLNHELRSKGTTDEEVMTLKNQLVDAENTIRKLEQEMTSASSELVNELQESLEKTRGQVLELRREVVQKNEKVHLLEMTKEEIAEQIAALKEELLNSKSANDEFEKKLATFNKESEMNKEQLELLRKENEETIKSNEELSKQLEDAKTSLKTFEGKVSMSEEEKTSISNKIATLEGQMEDTKSSMQYIGEVIGSDVKFRTLFFLQSMGVETRIDSLAQGVGVPNNVVHRILMELEKEGRIAVKKDGRHIFATAIEKNSPLQLKV